MTLDEARKTIEQGLINSGLEAEKAQKTSAKFLESWKENNVVFLRKEYCDHMIKASLDGLYKSS